MTSDVVQVVMLDVLRPRLTAWLASQGLTLGRMPDDEGEIPTYIVGVRLPGDTFTCPRCGAVSHNVNDVTYGYCGNCHAFTRNYLGEGLR